MKPGEFLKTHKRLLLAAVLCAAAILAATLIAMPYMKKLSEPDVQAAFKKWVLELGVWGVLLVLGIQMLQVVIAFLPGEPIELMAGVLYGGWWGLLLCLLGCFMASAGIFFLTKRFGASWVKRLFHKKKLEEYKFMQDPRKLEIVVFLVFLIPGTPKDVLTYIVGASPMKFRQFAPISLAARIPSVVSSTMIGASVRQGNWVTALVLFGLTALFGISGILLKDKVMAYGRKLGQRRKNKTS